MIKSKKGRKERVGDKSIQRERKSERKESESNRERKKRINVWATSFSIISLRKLRYQILEELLNYSLSFKILLASSPVHMTVSILSLLTLAKPTFLSVVISNRPARRLPTASARFCSVE